MIEKTAAYKTQDGKTHATLGEAQLYALEGLLGIESTEILDAMVDSSDEVIAILKMKPRKKREVKKTKEPKPSKTA